MRFALTLALALVAADDPRDIRNGRTIPDEGYCDQPYVVKTRDGHWLCLMTTGPGREGQTRETTYTFKVEGEKLTGTAQSSFGDQQMEQQITDGTVKGDAIAFTIVMNFNGNEVKLVHKGTIAGDEIKLTRQREGGDRVTEFVAKRVK